MFAPDRLPVQLNRPMALLTLKNLSLAFGEQVLLDAAEATLERGDKVCLLGRNGEGKSTLLRLIQGELNADDGELICSQGLRIAGLGQEVPVGIQGLVFDVVADGLGEVGEALSAYHAALSRLADDPDDAAMAALERAQHRLESMDGWQLEQRVEATVSRLSLDADAQFASLSGGMKRRVMLARALVREPDLLLLDEPTNHLDIASIEWLEEFMRGYGGTLLFITHDRAFLQRVATGIWELDRGRLTCWPGDYANFLRRKQETLEAEALAERRMDRKLAQEEAWIRQGIKARRTRNEGRVRALQALREERKKRRERPGRVRMSMDDAERSGKRVVEAKGITHAWEGRPVIQGLSVSIQRGDRVGIIGPNGCGKSTLLKILLGHLQPEQGTVQFGTRLEVAYFDQMRAQLNEEESVVDNVAQGQERITIAGQSKHVMGYLQDFLFSPARSRTPVKALSGGERNRLLLARLFTQPSNLLVMDEPTNDLDVETLELLEERLLDYQGTLLLVSHDRAFLNQVVTSTLVFEGAGRVGEYVGGYDDWLRQRPPEAAARPEPGRKPPALTPVAPKVATKKLSYKEQWELDGLPARIEALEQEQGALHERLGDADLYRRQPEQVAEAQARLEALEQELSGVYARWEALEGG